MARSKLNTIYSMMIQRCYNSNNKHYKNYGGRGITICSEWYDKSLTKDTKGHFCTKGWLSFYSWSITHGYMDNLTIDRIDNNKNYSPDNCRWVSRKEQSNNTRRNCLITYKGRTQTLMQWCEELQLKYSTVNSRLNRGHWSIEKIFEQTKNPRLKLIKYKGELKSLTEWCDKLHLNYDKIRARITYYNWSVEKAFETD